MKVILLQDIRGVGRRFEGKSVSDGYATNFLIPKKFAVPFTKQSEAMIKQLKEQSEAKKAILEQEINEKESKRLEKHLELEKFRQASAMPTRATPKAPARREQATSLRRQEHSSTKLGVKRS